MTYDELKKKIQSMRGFVVSDSKLEDYWKRGYNVALDGVLEKIEELENEEHPNGNFCCSRCGSELAVEKVEGCTLPIPSHPWSGRSEAEIREELAKTTQYLQRRTLEWVLSRDKCEHFSDNMTCPKCREPSEPMWTCHTCKMGGFTELGLEMHNNTIHANESHSASAPKEKCETVCHGGVDLKCKDCGAEYETNGFLTLKEKEVSREEKPDWIETMHLKVKPLEPNEAIDYRFEFNSANELFVAGNGVPKGTVARISTTPLFTLSEVADLMEKIEQSREFVKWLGTIEDEGVGAFWLVLRIIRERPDLVEKIRKEDLK